MHVAELDTLLCGAEGVKVTLSNGARLTLTRQALACAPCFRQAVWNQAGYIVPDYTPAQFDDVVRALIGVSCAEVLTPAA